MCKNNRRGNWKGKGSRSACIVPAHAPDALSEKIEQLKKSSSDKLSIHDVVRLEQYFGVSRQAILNRLLGEKEITREEADSMRQNVMLSALSLGYGDTLYKPTPKEKQYKTYGHYIRQAEKALEQGLISNGKYEELLLDAFRSELVFRDGIEETEILD